jgi:uncharacterized protein (DUF2147 family)
MIVNFLRFKSKFLYVSLMLSPVLMLSTCEKSIKDKGRAIQRGWITQFGAVTGPGDNSGSDACSSVTVDTLGNVYCAGYTSGSLGEENAGSANDAFIMKLNSNGVLQWITQLGAITGPGNNYEIDLCLSVAVDVSGNVYCAGFTRGAIGEANGGDKDAFVMKLNSGGALQWVTQLGALTGPENNSGEDECKGVAVDNIGNVYCAGVTSGAIGEANGGLSDAFVMKLNSSGVLQWVTQLGAITGPGNNSASDFCNGVAADSLGNVYCAGYTLGSLGEEKGGSGDAFVMKLNGAGGGI